MGGFVGIWGKMGGLSTPKCTPNSGANSTPNSGANSWAKSMAIPRLISEAKSRKSLKIVEDDKNLQSVFLGAHISRCVVPYWKMDDFGGVEVAGLAGGWLAGRASLKMLEPKDPILPRWGTKNASVLVGPPQNLLSVMLVSHFETICWRPEMR